MMENPELRAKILDWQRRYNIQDGDPALAFLELVEFMDRAPRGEVTQSSPVAPIVANASISPESLSEAMKTSLLPAIERGTFQSQELQKQLESVNFDQFVKQIEGYHEGIDYCTKKLDVVKKEVDALALRLENVGSQISPITKWAVGGLMILAAVLGFIFAVIVR